MRRLAAVSDVLLENFRTGAMEELGLGYDALRTVNPRLVYCSISGYGRTGPYADRPGYDFVVQAEGGMMGITGPADGPPYRVGVPIVDITAGMFCTTAVLAALRSRDLTVRASMSTYHFWTPRWLCSPMSPPTIWSAAEPPRSGNAHPNITPYEVFRARDRWFVLAAATSASGALLRGDWPARAEGRSAVRDQHPADATPIGAKGRARRGLCRTRCG